MAQLETAVKQKGAVPSAVDLTADGGGLSDSGAALRIATTFTAVDGRRAQIMAVDMLVSRCTYSRVALFTGLLQRMTKNLLEPMRFDCKRSVTHASTT